MKKRPACCRALSLSKNQKSNIIDLFLRNYTPHRRFPGENTRTVKPTSGSSLSCGKLTADGYVHDLPPQVPRYAPQPDISA